MNDEKKNKVQLIEELAEFRHRLEYMQKLEQRNRELEAEIDKRGKLEEQLWKNKKTFRALLNCPDNVVILVDTEGTILECNETFACRFGKSVDDLIGKSGWDLIPEGIVEQRKTFFEEVIRTGQPVRFEDERDGIWNDNSMYPVVDDNGQVIKVAVFARDITERHQMEEALRESEKWYRALFEATPVGIGIADLDGNVLAINQNMCEITGYSLEELQRIKLENTYVDPDDRRRLLQALQESGKVRDWEIELKKKDSTVYSVLLNMDLMEMGGQKVLFTNVRDITSYKKMEKALRQMYEELEQRVEERTTELQITSEQLQQEIVERRRAEETLARQVDEFSMMIELLQEKDNLLAAFNQIGKMALASLNREEILDTLAEQIVRVGIFRSLMIALVDEKRRIIEVVRNFVCPEEEERSPFDPPMKEGNRHVFKDGKANVVREHKIIGMEISLDDPRDCTAITVREGRLRVLDGYGFDLAKTPEESADVALDDPDDLPTRKIAYFIPVQRQDRVIAVLATGSHPETREKVLLRIEAMQPLLDQVAIVLEHARLYEDIQREIAERRQVEEELQESEEKYRTLFELANEALLILSLPEETIIDANRAAAQMLGYSPNELIGLSCWQHIIAPEILSETNREWVQQVEEKGSFLLEMMWVRKDGTRIPVMVSGKPLSVAGKDWFQLVGSDISERKRAEEMQRAFSRRSLQLQEEERQRMARELHDGVNQILSAARFRLQETESAETRTGRENREDISQTKELLSEAIREIRRISHHLRPSILDDLGLIPAVRHLGNRFLERTGTRVELECVGFSQTLSSELETTLYRIIQEALNNVEKHAQATDVRIRFLQKNAFLTVEIADDGKGFDVVSIRQNGLGMGLRNMRERAAMISGRMTLNSAKDKGTEISIEIPLQVEEQVLNA